MHGFAWSWYHEVTSLVEGLQMMLVLQECPATYQPCHAGMVSGAEGPRLAIIRNAADLLGEELVARIPADGFSPKRIKKLVTGTKYQALSDFAAWVDHKTGFLILDGDPEDFDRLDWDRATVDRIKREEPAAQEMKQRWEEFSMWLEENKRKNFSELLGFLLGEKIEIIAGPVKEQDAKAKNRKRAAQHADALNARYQKDADE
jgi:hypothetical protein